MRLANYLNLARLILQKVKVSEIGTKSEPNDNSGSMFRKSLPSFKKTVTLEEIIELARRKASHSCEEASLQKHYVIADDKLPVDEPAIQASEIVKGSEWNNDDWAYLEQLMESDTDQILLSDEPPTIIDNDDAAVASSLRCVSVHPFHSMVRNCF